MDLGITEQGYELGFDVHGEMISESDAYGGSLLDFFYRGVSVSNVFDSLEAKTAPMAAIWPWGTFGAPGVIGRLGSAISGAHVLTSTAGTPAAASPTSLTGARAIIPPGFSPSLLYNSKLRRVPIRFAYLPSDSFVIFTTT